MDNKEPKITFKNSYNILNTAPDQKTQLILEKIKLDEKPEYKAFLYNYFNDPSKYFLKHFKNNPIIVGKKYNKNNSFKIHIELKHSPKKKLRKATTLKMDLKNKSSSDMSSNSQNKANIPKEITTTNNNLKSGQRYVDDLEINEIFSNFKSTQKANKYKLNNHLTISDIRKFRAENLENSKSIKSRILLKKKSIILKKKVNILDIIQENNNNIYAFTENNIGNIQIPTKKSTVDNFSKYNLNINDSSSSNKNNNLLKMYQNNIYIKDKNTTISNDSITSKSNINLSKNNDSNKSNNKKINILNKSPSKNDNSAISFNFPRFYSTINENNKIDIFKKQNQYLTSEKYKIFKKELGNILVSQEKTFINDVNFKNKNLKMSLFMSNKLKVPKERLLMNRTEYFRINNDLRTRLSKQIQYEYIEDTFDWEKNLKNFDNKIKHEEIIRDPNYKIKFYPKRRFYSLKNEYLIKRISKRNLKKFVSNMDSIKNNFKGLYIKGKNLLELEHDLAKGIKGKKILNNYEEVLPFSSLKEEVYAKHFQL